MQLTYKQEEGLKIALERYKNHEKYTCISGYAGSGKSTLVRFIISALNISEDRVCYACYTGKAAQVLLKKGNKNVFTLHRLLYDSRPLPNGGFIRIPKRDIEPFKVVVVDEISMAPKTLINLLFNHNVYVICLGDPFQLPPIDKDEDNKLLYKPHIFLDEIMRQAQESEIIRLSMKVRNYEDIEYTKGNEVQVLPQGELSGGMMFWADQILCGTNATRINLNNNMREMLNRGELPEDGDKIICLRNYWDDIGDNGDPLVNGTIGYIKNSYKSFNKLPYWINNGFSFEIICADFISDSNSTFKNLQMDKKLILTGQKSLDYKTEYQLNKSFKTAHLVPKEFAYGYAITTHKAQGSEWDKVLVIEEGFPFSKEEHARWLYTAVTRASEKLVLIR